MLSSMNFGLKASSLDVIFGSALLLLSSIYVYKRYFNKKDEDDLLFDFNMDDFKPRARSSSVATPTFISDFVAQMRDNNKNVAIFFGSQTGTAEGLAKRFEQHLEAKFRSISPIVLNPEFCDIQSIAQFSTIKDSFIVFFLATYGEGEPTDNAVKFVAWLKEAKPRLDNIRYAIFGLGNSTYTHFNKTAKDVDRYLTKYGAVSIHPLGLGDDDKTLELDFIRWREAFTGTLTDQMGFVQRDSSDSVPAFKSAYTADIYTPNEGEKDFFAGEPYQAGSYREQKPPYTAQNPFMAKLVKKQELYKTPEERSCLILEFSLAQSQLQYEAGDHLGMVPSNDPERVTALEQLLPADNFNQFVYLRSCDPWNNRTTPFPCPCSLRTAFTHYLDLRSHLDSNLFQALMGHASSPQDQKMLKELSQDSEKGIELRDRWVRAAGRDLVDILTELPSCKPPVVLLCELLPRLQVRYYSISSAPEHDHCQTVHVTAAVIDYRNEQGRRVMGVATGQFQRMQPLRDSLPVFVRTSGFRLPQETQLPLILVGPGTGLAPFRGFLQKRHHMKESQACHLGSCMLFFGCRNADIDFMYESELRQYHAEGVITDLHLAFSRDPLAPEDARWFESVHGTTHGRKMYVQHRIQQQAERVWQLLDREMAHFYICGDAKNMARDVFNTMLGIAQTQGKLSPDAAKSYLANLEQNGRYQADVWS